MNARLRGGVGYRLLRGLVRALLRVGWGLRVEGLQRLPTRPPFLMTPNHGSEIDPIVLSAVLPFRPTYLAARELERFPVLFRLIRLFDPVFVRRGLADVGSVKACLARLAQGDVLVVFPEGRVVQSDDLGSLHAGAAFVAQRAGVPVVPVGLVGVDRMWPLGARWPHASRIAVRVGSPLLATGLEEADTLTERIGQAIRRLVREGA